MTDVMRVVDLLEGIEESVLCRTCRQQLRRRSGWMIHDRIPVSERLIGQVIPRGKLHVIDRRIGLTDCGLEPAETPNE